MACLLTLTLLEITFSMLYLGEAKRDRITDVSSLVLVVSLSSARLPRGGGGSHQPKELES